MIEIFIKIQTRMAMVLPDSVFTSIVFIIDDKSILHGSEYNVEHSKSGTFSSRKNSGNGELWQ